MRQKKNLFPVVTSIFFYYEYYFYRFRRKKTNFKKILREKQKYLMFQNSDIDQKSVCHHFFLKRRGRKIVEYLVIYSIYPSIDPQYEREGCGNPIICQLDIILQSNLLCEDFWICLCKTGTDIQINCVGGKIGNGCLYNNYALPTTFNSTFWLLKLKNLICSYY